MSTSTIAIAENALDESDVRAAAAATGATIVPGPLSTPEEVARTTEGADALLVTLQPLRAQHVAAISDTVKVIARAGVGLDSVDVEAARARGIRVIYQPAYATNEVADHASAMVLASWRRLAEADALVRTAGWGSFKELGTVSALQDSTLGVLGTGRIGQEVIRRLRAFVARVVVFDAFPNASLADVEWADSIEHLLSQSNIVTLHLPLRAETRHLIDAEAIDSMPRGAVLVNVSRGGLVDEGAVAAALVSGKLGAAALDVFEREPLQDDSPLRAAPNLLLSPHVAWYSAQSAERLTSWSVEDAVTFLRSGVVRRGLLA